MKWLINLTRMWLLRERAPFEFKNEYDNQLPYENCQGLGLYVHIPFCRRLCNFCPYCKVLYDKALADRYIDALLDEIHLVGRKQMRKKEVTSLYFGGGTPVLVIERLAEVIETLRQYFIIKEGIGIELHPEDVTIKNLSDLKAMGITKISIGIQSFSKNFQVLLGREQINVEAFKDALEKVPFETVSMDFIFALPKQSFQDLKNDIDLAFTYGANHIALYPFIDFTFTSTRLTVRDKKEKRKLLDEITTYAFSLGLKRTSIWTFSKAHCSGYSSMTRDNFLGFGVSATTLLKKQFKINTFSIPAYIERVKEKKLPTALTLRFSMRKRMIYYLFWMAYSTKVSSEAFEEFFSIPLKKVYGCELFLLRCLGFIKKSGSSYEMTLKGAFYYHHYENYYTLSYIDKMWGLMQKEAFPKEMKL